MRLYVGSVGADKGLRRTVDDLPYPPFPLANRVGALPEHAPFAQYEQLGALAREEVCSALPADWAWTDKCVLDLGCGAGRTLRHFLPEARIAKFHGCDIDAESITWVREHLCPPFDCFVNAELPPLPLPPSTFDVVYAISVFTHLTSTWSAWLIEVHRVLRPGGLALLTFMGRGMYQIIAGQPLDEDAVGMVALRAGQSWDFGGPMVLHSPWWIREHWGRAFEVLALRPDGFVSRPGDGQGIVTLRKREIDLTPEDLERPGKDPREPASLRTNLRLLQEESRIAREALASTEHLRQLAERRITDLERERGELLLLRDQIRALEHSRSWRFTAPLRALRRAVARWEGRGGS
jgi:SAM-dependent methyltransferase